MKIHEVLERIQDRRKIPGKGTPDHPLHCYPLPGHNIEEQQARLMRRIRRVESRGWMNGLKPGDDGTIYVRYSNSDVDSSVLAYHPGLLGDYMGTFSSAHGDASLPIDRQRTQELNAVVDREKTIRRKSF